MMDIYRDYFSKEELLLSLKNTQYIPGLIGSLNLFQSIGMTGLSMAIESLPDNDVAESAATVRGAPGKPLMLEKRNVKTFTSTSYAWQAAVLADEVLSIRSAGTSGASEVFMTRRDELVAKLRRQADWQLEYLRTAVINSPDNAFGSAPASAAIAFGTSDTAIRSTIFEKITLPLESALGGLPYSGVIALCEDTFWKALIDSKTIRETYLNQTAASELRNAPADTVNFGGVQWIRHRAGGNIKITTGKAKVIPQGVSGLFIQGFAPNDTMSSVGVGALGQPYYLDSYPLDDDKGYRMSMQTHPLMLCTRPETVLTIGLS
jgi:hypothetical protein